MTEDNLLDFTTEIETNPLAGVSTRDGFAPLPRNDDGYLVSIVKSSIKPYVGAERSMKSEVVEAHLLANPATTPGKKLAIEGQIIEGEFQGRKVWWDFLLLPASDQKAFTNFSVEAQVKAGKTDLMGLIKRAGLKAIIQPEELLGGQARVPCGHDKTGKYNRWFFALKEAGEPAADTPPAPRPRTAANTVTRDDDEPAF